MVTYLHWFTVTSGYTRGRQKHENGEKNHTQKYSTKIGKLYVRKIDNRIFSLSPLTGFNSFDLSIDGYSAH